MMLTDHSLTMYGRGYNLHMKIVEVEKATGLLGSFYPAYDQALVDKNLDQAHQKIAESGRALTTGWFEFELRLLECLRRSFSKLERQEPSLIKKTMRDHYELRNVVDFYTDMSYGQMDQRGRFASRIDLQLRIVSTPPVVIPCDIC